MTCFVFLRNAPQGGFFLKRAPRESSRRCFAANLSIVIQNRNCVTLAYVPGMIDQIVSQLVPGSFDAKLKDSSDNVRANPFN